MLQKIIVLAMVLLCTISAFGESPRVFTGKDVVTDFGLGRNRFELLSAYDGSDPSGFNVRWHDVAGGLALIQFSGADGGGKPQSLWGWIHIGPEILNPKPIKLTLVDSKTLQHTFADIDMSTAGEFAMFRLPVPQSGQCTFLMHLPDTDGSVTFCGIQLSAEPPATQPQFTLPASGLQPLPAADLVCQQVHEFAGNDFDPHANTPLDELGLNPVTVMWGNQTRKIDVLVPSASPQRVIQTLSLDDPPITSSDYAIAGEISYGSVHAGFTMSVENLSAANSLSDGDVEGTGYLEMISDFADGSSISTRTLADSGPMRMIRGRSGPRPILLPYHSSGKRPTRIRLNLVMSGRGTIALSNLRLVQYVPGMPITAGSVSRLFSSRLIWLPVWVLPFFGLVALLEPMIRRGKGRVIVIGWIWTFFALAQFCFAWTMAAWGHGLPMREVSPALLVSVLILGCALFASRRMSRRYRDVELRKMQLMDAV